MDKRRIVESLALAADGLLAEREPGPYVEVSQHHGGRATEADIAARDAMKSEARRLRPHAMFISEDTNSPDSIAQPGASKPAEAFLADPCDGSRQFGQLGFGYASCVSLHSYQPGHWWRVDAAAIAIAGKLTSEADGLILGVGGNTDDSIDLRQETTPERVRIPPCVAVGASSPSGIPLLSKLMRVRDPEVCPDATGEDPHLRVWNTAGNPITQGLLRSGTMVAVQLKWSTQWDTLFAYFGSVAGLNVYPLVWSAQDERWCVGDDGRPAPLNEFDRRHHWGRPRWHTYERLCIPPLVVGPDEPYTHEVLEIVQSSDVVQRRRPGAAEVQRRFESAFERDRVDLLRAWHTQADELGM